MKISEKIVNEMYANDAFSKWLGIEKMEISEGNCKLRMKVRKEMLNGFNIAHGGIAYSLADSALAFAANSHGSKSLSIETKISHLKPVKEGDILTAIVIHESLTDKKGQYIIKIINQKEIEIAVFNGIVHRTSKIWFYNNEK